MRREMYNSLQLREIFHLEFLRWLSRTAKVKSYAVKGGVNLRFFFNSFRYSEDMDLDIQDIGIETLKDIVMKILNTPTFQSTLKPFGIQEVVPPDISRAKQTQTTQRFKVHLITSAGEDLFTKVEFSRRGFKGNIVVQPVSDIILRAYKLPPLLIPHYDIQSAVTQKIDALATRAAVQARDVFDLYLLSSQYHPVKTKEIGLTETKLTKAYKNLFSINFEQFRDTVISYLSTEDQPVYNSPPLWDEVKLKAADFIDEVRR
ncbi:MAG: nucleotidyl transferase AbiEii/AbiGii toxin family protein [Candidatus Omnitrophota bacterium]